MAVQHVLVVEDDAAVSEALQELLRRSGLSARGAGTIDEAERIFGVIPVDAILLDATLGVGSLNTVPFLRKIRGGGFLGLVIAISGYAEHNDVLCKHGANMGIQKVFCARIVDAVRSF